MPFRETYSPETATPSPRKRVVLAPVPSTVKLKIQCGCGALFESIEEGIDHTTDTGHSSTISGEIRAQY